MLVVLGNGFDLQCGLRSDYKSYFDYRYKNILFQSFIAAVNEIRKLRLNETTNLLTDYNIRVSLTNFMRQYSELIFDTFSFWDIVFILERTSLTNDNWYSIENMIQDYIVNDKVTLSKLKPQKNELVSSKSNDDTSLVLTIGSILLEYKQLQFSQVGFNAWLQGQLLIIEESFKDYLNITLNDIPFYNNKAQQLFYRLISKDVNEVPAIISFNYTTPQLVSLRSGIQYSIDNVINVHGKISDKIIFGIDEKIVKTKAYLEPSDLKYSFTKTSRQMFDLDESRGFKLTTFKFDNSIIFYGHSLNYQDYSYFQSIFDYYNIYSSDIKLVFAYSIFDKRVKIKSILIDSVIKLIKEYGTTMQNTNHGSNLLHKLILENRIILKNIDSINDVDNFNFIV